MRRLYLKIYLTVIAVLVLVLIDRRRHLALQRRRTAGIAGVRDCRRTGQQFATGGQ